MIPEFVDGVRLPQGAHECSWEELVERFGSGQRRQELCGELQTFIERARRCGFIRVGIWGSFATSELEPGDLDLFFVIPRGMTRSALRAECAELLMPDSAFQRRFGHNALHCHDEPEVLNQMIAVLGYNWRVGAQQGILLLDLTCT